MHPFFHQLDCFHVVAVTNRATLNVLVYVSKYMCKNFSWDFWVEVKLIFNLQDDTKLFSEVVAHISSNTWFNQNS